MVGVFHRDGHHYKGPGSLIGFSALSVCLFGGQKKMELFHLVRCPEFLAGLFFDVYDLVWLRDVSKWPLVYPRVHHLPNSLI